MKPAVYNFPSVKKGNSVQAQNIATITYETGSVPIPLSFAEIVVKDLNGCVYLTWNTVLGQLSISGADSNIVIKNFFSKNETSLWDVGTYTYELTVDTVAGETWAVLIGTMEVE